MNKENLVNFIRGVIDAVPQKSGYRSGVVRERGSIGDEDGIFEISIYAPSPYSDDLVTIEVDLSVDADVSGSPEESLALLARRLRDLADNITPSVPASVAGAPYGFQLGADGRTLEPCASEQRVIARARELRAAGLSESAIAEDLAFAGLLRNGTAPNTKA